MARALSNKYKIGDTVFYMQDNVVHSGVVNAVILKKEIYMYRLTESNDINWSQFTAEAILFPTKDALLKSL